MSSVPIVAALISLRRQHHSLYPPYLLHFPPPSDLASTASQAYLVDHILQDPVIRDIQPEREYRRAFWRRSIDAIEQGVRKLQDDDPDNVDVGAFW